MGQSGFQKIRAARLRGAGQGREFAQWSKGTIRVSRGRRFRRASAHVRTHRLEAGIRRDTGAAMGCPCGGPRSDGALRGSSCARGRIEAPVDSATGSSETRASLVVRRPPAVRASPSSRFLPIDFPNQVWRDRVAEGVNLVLCPLVEVGAVIAHGTSRAVSGSNRLHCGCDRTPKARFRDFYFSVV